MNSLFAQRDLWRDGLIRSCGRLESGGPLVRNNRYLRAAGEDRGGHAEQD